MWYIMISVIRTGNNDIIEATSVNNFNFLVLLLSIILNFIIVNNNGIIYITTSDIYTMT